MGGMTNWGNLTKNTRTYLENDLGISEDDYKKFEKVNDVESFKKLVEEKTKALYKSNVYKNLANAEATDEEKKQEQELESYKNKYHKDNIEEFKNKIKELKELDVKDFTLEATFPVEEVKQYEDLLDKLYLKDSKTFKNLPIEVIESQGQVLQGLIGKFGESGELGKTYEKFVQTIKGFNLTTDLQNTLLRFNPADLDGMTKNEARETLMSLFQSAIDDGKIGEEAAKKTVDSYLNELENSNLGNFSILSTNALNKIEEEVKEKYNKIVTNYKTAIDTINSNITNGFIDFLDKDKIEDAIKELDLDPSDYIFTDEKGNYQVDVEALNEDVKQQAQDESKITDEIKAQIQNGIDQLKQKEDLIQSIINQCQSEQENYKIQKKLTAEYAKQNALRNDKDLRDIEKQYDIDWNDDGSALISSKTLSDLKAGLTQITTQREELEKSLKDDKYIQSLVNIAKSASNKIDQTFKTYTDTTENLKKENDKAYKDWIDKTKAVTEAQKNLTKAIETVTEKQKELKELIEGTNYKSSIDGMYNYTTAMDYWVKETERAKKKLEKAGSITEAKNNYQLYGEGLLKQKSNLIAQNKTYQTAYDNFGNVLKNDLDNYMKSLGYNKTDYNIEDFVTLDKITGIYQLNQNATNNPGKINQYIKKWFDENGTKANEYRTKIKENNDKIEQLDEEFLEYQKKARDEYIDLQDQMIEILREKYQKEIDDLQNKYDAMNEADNKYLESLQKNLEKQRKLRDQEKNWNDLTNKERKLSLMQRDTSGGNLADVKNLQEEIDDQRTQLLDDAVDQIIEKLTEFYELQREARDAEIEYKQTLIDDVTLLKEATEALEKIQTSDDLVNWWKENVTGIEAFSEQKLTKLTEDWDKLFNAKSQYIASIDKKMETSIKDTNGHLKDVSDEAVKIVETTSEGITELAKVSLEEAGKEYKDALKKAKEALQDAQDAVQKQKDALNAAIEAAKEAQKAFNEIAAKYKESLSKAPKTETVYVVNGTKTTDKDHVPTLQAQAAMYGNSTAVTTEKVTGRESKQIAQEERDLRDSKPSGNWGITPKTKNVEFMQRGDSIYTTTEWQKNAEYKKGGYGTRTPIEIPYTTVHGVLKYNEKNKKWEFVSGSSSDTVEKAKEYIEEQIKKISIPSNVPTSVAESIRQAERKKYYAFAEGGLVNYTGPAWVDGSRSKPEAFLSSEDTRRIGEAARILADLPILSQPIKEQVPTTTIGDTTIQIDVHVDSIANDYDLDEAMNKVEQRIVNAAKYAGSNVILKKH